MPDQPTDIQAVTDAQTSLLKRYTAYWNVAKLVVIPIFGAVLSVIGYKVTVTQTTPTSVPDATLQVKGIIESYKLGQQAAPPPDLSKLTPQDKTKLALEWAKELEGKK